MLVPQLVRQLELARARPGLQRSEGRLRSTLARRFRGANVRISLVSELVVEGDLLGAGVPLLFPPVRRRSPLSGVRGVGFGRPFARVSDAYREHVVPRPSESATARRRKRSGRDTRPGGSCGPRQPRRRSAPSRVRSPTASLLGQLRHSTRHLHQRTRARLKWLIGPFADRTKAHAGPFGTGKVRPPGSVGRRADVAHRAVRRVGGTRADRLVLWCALR